MRRALAILFFSAAVSAGDMVSPSTVDVFTHSKGSDMRITRLQLVLPDAVITTHTVDDVRNAEDALSVGMPTDPGKAEAWFSKRLNHGDTQKLMEQVTQGYDALLAALEHRIDRLPAVVFDGKYVVYGEDTIEALRVYRKTMSQRAKGGQ